MGLVALFCRRHTAPRDDPNNLVLQNEEKGRFDRVLILRNRLNLDGGGRNLYCCRMA